jgi:hypothetical protein
MLSMPINRKTAANIDTGINILKNILIKSAS